MCNQMMRWNWVKDTDNAYIITNTGKVFSRYTCDYISPQENEAGFIFYTLKISGKMKSISLKRLLEEAFE